jgi:hypothetical protein
MKRFLGYLLGIALVLIGIFGVCCEISDWSTHFTFFGYAFAGAFLLGGVFVIRGVRSHYGGGLWTAIGYVLTANGIIDAFSSLDHYLKKVDPPNRIDFFICSVCLVLGIAFLNQGHKRHSCQSANDSPLRFDSQPQPRKLLRSAPWAPAWLGVIFGVWFMWHYLSTGFKLHTFVQTWKREGLPITHEEIDNWYPTVPTNQNAALIYLQAVTNLVEADCPSIKRLAHQMVSPDRAQFDSERNQLQGILLRNRQALYFLFAAATNSQSRYPLELDGELAPDLSYLRKLEVCAELLALETSHRGNKAGADRAIDSITAILALGNSLAREPFFISQRCREICNATAASQIEWVLQSFKLNDPELQRLADALHQSEQIPAPSGAYVVDFCYAMRAEPYACIDQSIHGHPFFAGTCKAIVLLTDRESADKLYYANSVRTCLKALKNPYPLRLQMLPDSNSEKRYMLQHGYFVSAYFMGWRRAFSLVAAEDCALVRDLLAAVAIERYRNANNGVLPQTLNELCPRFLAAVPEDPFDGYSLRYQRSEQTFSVYSIGRDIKDNDGKIWQQGQKPNQPYDIVVRIGHKTDSKAITSAQN